MIRILLGFIAATALAARAGAVSPQALGPLPMSQSLFEQGRYGEAAGILSSETMQKLRGKDLKAATLTLAKSYEHLNKLDKALSIYQLGIKLFPKDIPLLTGLAQLFYSAHLEERARPLYGRILERDPDNISAHLGLASIDHILGFLERSADHYEIVLEQSPEDAALWRDYAKVLFEMRDFKTAELAIGRSLSLAPASTESLLAQAFIDREEGRIDDALHILKQLVASGVRQPIVVCAYALWLLEAGRYEEAMAQSRAALGNPETEAAALWVQAQVYLKTGRKALAEQALRGIPSVAPGSFTAKASAVILRQLTAP